MRISEKNGKNKPKIVHRIGKEGKLIKDYLEVYKQFKDYLEVYKQFKDF